MNCTFGIETNLNNMAKKKNNLISSFLSKHSSAERERYISINLDVVEQIYAILDDRGWSQKDLAKRLEKSDAEISKWLSGMHNLTLRSLGKIEAVLGETIILTPLKAKEKYKKIEYITFKVYDNRNKKIDNSGFSEDIKTPVRINKEIRKIQAV